MLDARSNRLEFYNFLGKNWVFEEVNYSSGLINPKETLKFKAKKKENIVRYCSQQTSKDPQKIFKYKKI